MTYVNQPALGSDVRDACNARFLGSPAAGYLLQEHDDETTVVLVVDHLRVEASRPHVPGTAPKKPISEFSYCGGSAIPAFGRH